MNTWKRNTGNFCKCLGKVWRKLIDVCFRIRILIFINFFLFPILSRELAESVPIKVDQYTYDSPHTKTHLLLQAHFSRLPLPIADYGTDTKSVLDQAIRIVQAMIDVCADEGWLSTVLQIIILMQMVVQGRWYYDSPLLQLPRVNEDLLQKFVMKSRMR